MATQAPDAAGTQQPKRRHGHRRHHKVKTGPDTHEIKEIEHPPEAPHFRNILLPIDGSEISGQALRYSVALVKKLRAHLTVFHASADAEQGWLLLNAATEVCSKAGVTDVDPAYLPQEPAQALLPQTKYYDLVVMATHGRHGLDRLVFGSMTECVLRHGECPVLCLKDQERDFASEVLLDTFQILLCVDGSEAADHALDVTVSLLKQLRCGITLGYVIKDAEPSATKGLQEAGLVWDGPSRPAEQLHEEAFKTLGAAAAKLQGQCDTVPKTRAEPSNGRSVADVILAMSHGFNLVVLGTRGREGASRTLSGSITEQVVRGSTVPILAVGPHCR